MKSHRCWSLLTITAAAAGALLLGCEPTGPTEVDSSTPRHDASTGHDTGTHTDASVHPDTAGHDVVRTDTAGRDTRTGADSNVVHNDSAGTDGSVTAVDKTIQEIQGGSVTVDSCVRVQAVVMSVVFADRDDEYSPPDAGSTPHQSFYISVKGLSTTAPNTGIEVVATNVTAPSVVPGDDVTVVGKYGEHYEFSTLRLTAECGQVTKNASGLTLPTAATVTMADLGQTGGGSGCPNPTPAWTENAAAETWEGVLVKIVAGTVDVGMDNYGTFGVSDGTYKLQVSDMLISNSTLTAQVNQTVQSITGFEHFSWCRRKLRPKADADVTLQAVPINCGNAARADHLVVSEVKTQPTGAEFVEIFNPTNGAIALDNYYLYNATYPGGTNDAGVVPACYYHLITTGAQCGTAFGDFSLRFPAGSSIAAGAYQVIAMTGSVSYCTALYPNTTCVKPNYEIPLGSNGDVAVGDMAGQWDTLATSFLSNASEDLVLFSWDGSAATVKDVDYFVWGTDERWRTSKTGVGTYLADTAVASQTPMASVTTAADSYQRVCYNEGTETKSGGNGLTGHNETSENLAGTFIIATPTPGVVAVGAQ